MRPYGLPRAARSRCSRRSQEGEPQTMSDNDQQYPYDPGHGQQRQGQEPYDPAAYGQQPYDPYGQPQSPQPYDPAHGQPQNGPQPAYGPQQPSYPQSYPQQQQQPYPQQQEQQPYGRQPAVHPEQGAFRTQPADQGVAQTWQGQTWDTTYQPTIQPQHPAAPTGQGGHPLPPEAPARQPQYVPAAPPAQAAPAAA